MPLHELVPATLASRLRNRRHLNMTANKSASDGLAIVRTQVEAATRVHASLVHWGTSDAALARLKSSVPGFSAEAALLKTVALNELYATRVLATGRMARHITKIMQSKPGEGDPMLVEKIAALPDAEGNVPRMFTSFAAKFCHFFVDSSAYLLYDDAARTTLKLHLGSQYRTMTSRQYEAYCDNFARLVDLLPSKFTRREIDRYLWLTGMYMRWLHQREDETPKINAELLQLFENPGERATALDEMLPTCLERIFKL